MKAKCIVDYDSYLTMGKVYDVHKIDEEGDIWITDDVGEDYIMFPDECELIEEE